MIQHPTQRSGSGSLRPIQLSTNADYANEYEFAAEVHQRFDKSNKKFPTTATTKQPPMYPGSHSPSPVSMDEGSPSAIVSGFRSKLEPQDPEHQMINPPKIVVSTDVERSNSAPPVLGIECLLITITGSGY